MVKEEELQTTLHAQDPSNLPEKLKNMVKEDDNTKEEVVEVVEIPVEDVIHETWGVEEEEC